MRHSVTVRHFKTNVSCPAKAAGKIVVDPFLSAFYYLSTKNAFIIFSKKPFQPPVKAQAAWLCSGNGTPPLVSKTASHVFECSCLRLAPNRKMSLLLELLSEANVVSFKFKSFCSWVLSS